MPEHKRPSSKMKHMVDDLETWKKNVMFVIGMAGVAFLVWWFISDGDHVHSKLELLAAGGASLLCAWLAFPVGVTRMLDKFVPSKFRHDPNK